MHPLIRRVLSLENPLTSLSDRTYPWRIIGATLGKACGGNLQKDAPLRVRLHRLTGNPRETHLPVGLSVRMSPEPISPSAGLPTWTPPLLNFQHPPPFDSTIPIVSSDFISNMRSACARRIVLRWNF
ncbi:Hypothetical protein NTJ_12619 [Nesidiocoris tenuis]|nr:Hypothetical protein NTJ_12619 [Nesidiocoris tenuis]